MSSWHARAAILKLLQVAVFGNLFILQAPAITELIQNLVLTRLLDVQIEVRELAAITLSGLIHCGYLQADKKMVVCIIFRIVSIILCNSGSCLTYQLQTGMNGE